MASLMRRLRGTEAANVGEISPNAIDDYLATYNALEAATNRTQGLIDALHRAAFVLNHFGASGGRSDAWKTADIEELELWCPKRRAIRSQISLTAMPTAQQLLEAIADWRDKREQLDQQWDRLTVEAQAVLKSPATLD